MKHIVIAAACCALAGCSSGNGLGSAQPTCEGLIADVTSLVKEKNDVEIIEVNNIQTILDSGGELKCNGVATTDRGDAFMEYGVSSTQQGKQLLDVSFPHGF